MRKKTILILMSLLILASCTTNGEEQNIEVQSKYVSTEIVEKKNFSENIKLPGKVSSSKETAISSLSSGIINTINVKVGDKVKAGDILATVDTTSNLANINFANAVNSYNNAITVYNTTKESLDKGLEASKLQYDNAILSRNNTYTNTEKQLELAKAQLDSVITQKGNTNQSSTTSLDLAEKSLENAKLNLENFLKNSDETIKNLEIKKASLLDNIAVAVEGSFILFDNSFTEMDRILGVTDLYKSVNANYDIYLSAKDSSIKTELKAKFLPYYDEYKALKKEYNNLSISDLSDFSEEQIMYYYGKVLITVNNNIELLDKMVLMLNNSVTSSSLSASTLESMKSGMVTFQSQSSTLKSNLITLNNSYIDTKNSINSNNTTLTTQKATLEQSIKIAQSTYDNTKASINTSLDTVSSTENTTRIQYESTEESVKTARETADNNLKIAENQYNAAKANYDAQIASLKAQIDASSGQKNSLGQQIENSQIRAPYDGVIISRNIEIGSTIGQGAIAFSIANSEEKIIKIEVNSDNIKYLNVGKNVRIEKGSFSGEGIISLVGAGTNSSTGMYPIEITFDNNTDFGKSIVLGDFVDVYIQKEIGIEGKIVIPFSSLIAGSSGTYHVYVVTDDNIVEERIVNIGDSNSSEVIILSGLEIGDKLITSGALNVVAGDKVEEK